MNHKAMAWGVRAQFFAAGGLFATWGIHVPTVNSHYQLGEQGLAYAMLAAGVGALFGLTQASRVIARFGLKPLLATSAAVCGLCLALLVGFDHWLPLGCLLVLFGVTNSWIDVSVNVAASELERAEGRPLMSGFHGMFSLGGMVGAGLGGLMLSAGASAGLHLALASVLCVLLVWVGAVAMPTVRADSSHGSGFAVPSGALLLLGGLACLGFVAEGAMYDWSVLYLEQELRADALTASMAYASFSAAMAAARFGGDWVRERVDSVRLLQLSGTVAALGMSLSLWTSQAWVALLGFALVGLGFANIVPVLFSAAANTKGMDPARSIASVASLGYLGMMMGPPMIGFIAHRQSLTIGLSAVVVAALLLVGLARVALTRASR